MFRISNLYSLDLYREHILDHYKNPRNFGELKKADVSARVANAFCGDMVELQLQLENQKLKTKNQKHKRKNKRYIKEIRFRGIGCAISTAAASLLTERIKGMSLDKAGRINEDDIIKLLGIEITAARRKCALLALEALKECLRKYHR